MGILNRKNPTTTDAWSALLSHAEKLKQQRIEGLFRQDSSRFDQFSVQLDDLLFDFSRNLADQETMQLLKQLAEEVGLADAMEKMFAGKPINETEGRPVLHMALRSANREKFKVDGKPVGQYVQAVLDQMREFTDALLKGEKAGFNGQVIKHVVNIGIGGSDLGPRMVTEALKPYHSDVQVHFVSNVDGSHLTSVLKGLKPENTLFIVASKTFTTDETMTNAKAARSWYLESGNESDIQLHFAAVTSNTEAAKSFGIREESIFEFWDWVGGRFSLWSAIGLPICCAIGFNNFQKLLSGAHEADNHFESANFEENIPVIMALLSIWNINFMGATSEAVIPYYQNLRLLPSYLQQAVMESNGKSVDRDGQPLDYQTSPVIWGAAGTDGQHAFFQQLHQGTAIVPCDFISAVNPHHSLEKNHHKLLANFLAQPQALMVGKTEDAVKTELASKGLNQDSINKLAPFKRFEGNRPSNLFLFKKITPHALGKLIAFYEHKIFVQGILWNIFSFDQWGVELGKGLATEMYQSLTGSGGEPTPEIAKLLEVIKDFKDG